MCVKSCRLWYVARSIFRRSHAAYPHTNFETRGMRTFYLFPITSLLSFGQGRCVSSQQIKIMHADGKNELNVKRDIICIMPLELGVILFNATVNTVMYVVAASFIGGGNRSVRRKPPTCRKSLTNFIT